MRTVRAINRIQYSMQRCPLRLDSNISQIMCSTRFGNRQFSMHCSPLWFLGPRMNVRSQQRYIVAVQQYRHLSSSSSGEAATGPRGVIVLSGTKSAELPVKGLKQEDELLWQIVGQLNEDHGLDVCVIKTAAERKKYADYVIVVSGGSTRHLKAMTNHLYEKSKKDFNGPMAIVSGMDSTDWMIVDMGSIVVHVFLPETRAKYELEKLWSLGPDEDEQYKAMVEHDTFSEVVKNVKLDDFFVKEKEDDERTK